MPFTALTVGSVGRLPVMMPSAQSLIDELDEKLRKSSNSQHLDILRRVTDLFLVGADAYTDEQIAIFDDVISRLIENMDNAVLIELCARLVPVSKAPANVLARLSGFDDIAISGPALEMSETIPEQKLVEIAGSKSQKHLAAIAGRSQISERVTELLVDRGNAEVSRKVSANLGARFSEIAFVKLINKAKSDKALAATIAKREDLPEELVPFLKLALG
jgi:uncharacterized protein (DUF2336 family)